MAAFTATNKFTAKLEFLKTVRSRARGRRPDVDIEANMPDNPDSATADNETGSRVAAKHDRHAGRQLRLSALAVGLCVGTIMNFSNMYFGLQTGWVTMGSLQSAILGFGMFHALQRCGMLSSFSVADNVIVQTMSVATATMPLAAGFVGVIPALEQLTAADNPRGGAIVLSNAQLVLWSAVLAFFGVFVAVPLRIQTIVREKLRFPSGTATAQVIAVLHRRTTAPQSSPSQARFSDSGINLAAMAVGGAQHADVQSTARYNAMQHDDTDDFSTVPSRSLDVPGAVQDSGALPYGDTMPRSAQQRVEAERIRASMSWTVLFGTFAASFAFTILCAAVPVIGALPVLSWIGWRAATRWGWVLSLSTGYIGQGMIMGPRTCASMLAGALVGWSLLAPIAQSRRWTTEESGGAGGWLTWVSLAIMLGDSMTSLLLLTVPHFTSCCVALLKRLPWLSSKIGLYRKLTFDSSSIDHSQQDGLEGGTAQHSMQPLENPDHKRLPHAIHAEATQHSSTSDESEYAQHDSKTERDVPPAWWGTGLVVTSATCAVVLSAMFTMPWYEPLVAVVVALFVAVLAVRALGETDLNPVGGVGKLSQLVFAAVAPGKVVANLVAGAVAEAAAQQAGDMMQDFKTAALLGVCPRAQFIAMLAGSGASIFVSVVAYALYTSAYEIPGPQFHVPSAAIWLNMAKLVNGGELPRRVLMFGIIGGCGAAVMQIISAVAKRQLQREAARSSVDGTDESEGVVLNTDDEIVTVARGSRRNRGAMMSRTTATALRVAATALRVAAHWLPSGIAFAIGMYIPPRYTIPRVIGSVIDQIWLRRAAASHDALMMVTASGLVLGEGVGSVACALATVFMKQ